MNIKKCRATARAAALFSVILSSGNYLHPQKTEATTDKGNLSLVANGEDFVRQGFITKDGWQIKFNHLYVNLADVAAYQTESGFEPTEGKTTDDLKYQAKVVLVNNSQTVDLAAGEADAAPILVNKVPAATGFYNALSWKIVPAEGDSPIAGKTMVLQGQAAKNGQKIPFNLSFNLPITYLCGEYIGEERQGIVDSGTDSQVETTFHFDHLFGDRSTAADDALNVEALGFQPLANLASGNELNLDDTTLAQQLAPKNYQKLTNAIIGLGHVGEGHCVANL